jgi:ribosomal-protein-alanine N-acetyltransferase
MPEPPELTDEELAELVELERVCYPPEESYSEEFIRELLRMAGCHLVRWRVRGQLAGFQISNLEMAELITLDVHPDFRRQGLGSSILGETLEKMRRAGLPRVFCAIATDNEPSVKLHQRFGFEICGVHPNYYDSGRDAYVLMKPLKNER